MLSNSKNVLPVIEQNTGTNMCLKYFQIKDPIEKEETAKRYTDMYVVLVLNGNDQ